MCSRTRTSIAITRRRRASSSSASPIPRRRCGSIPSFAASTTRSPATARSSRAPSAAKRRVLSSTALRSSRSTSSIRRSKRRWRFEPHRSRRGARPPRGHRQGRTASLAAPRRHETRARAHRRQAADHGAAHLRLDREAPPGSREHRPDPRSGVSLRWLSRRAHDRRGARARRRRPRGHRVRRCGRFQGLPAARRSHLSHRGRYRGRGRHVLPPARSERLAGGRAAGASSRCTAPVRVLVRDARAGAMSAAAGFVWDPRLASHIYRSDHPLKPWRLQGVHDTLERLGAFALPNARVLEPRLATRAELERIHDPAYVDAIKQASADPNLDYSEWGLSLAPWADTPPFSGMHEASLLTTGAPLVASEAVIAGKARVAFNGAGGLHHAMRGNASGFCIYNDPAIVCGALADRGMKVAYVDIDAHHGDGVQAAFYDTDQVLTSPLHEYGIIPRP